MEEIAWCKTHPTKKVGKDQSGNWYDQCYEGYKERQAGMKVTCEIVIEKGGEK